MRPKHAPNKSLEDKIAEIPICIRQDWEMYMMGQIKQKDIMKKRGLTTGGGIKIFNILLAEKMLNDSRDAQLQRLRESKNII